MKSLNLDVVVILFLDKSTECALGLIGRDPADVASAPPSPPGGGGGGVGGGGGGKGEYDAREGAPLTSREYRALKAYAGKELGLSPKDFDRAMEYGDDDDLIPHNMLLSGSSIGDGVGGGPDGRTFDADLDLAYLDARLHRRAFGRSGGGGDADSGGDPFADLLPSDLNPARKVNRRNVHPVPSRLLHHNNLGLLRRYTTPGGKIMNSVQSRLGAKDQCKIAKLIKRARHLGLIPHIGQWKVEDHGDVHEDGGGGGMLWPRLGTGRRNWKRGDSGLSRTPRNWSRGSTTWRRYWSISPDRKGGRSARSWTGCWVGREHWWTDEKRMAFSFVYLTVAWMSMSTLRM
ncbi:LOW QUALITY PROTEIN: hypothetical protein ACHAW5_002250 [Stephanodiscus triporus]|uniref:Ribosomal protein S18 n=1 Tax=Stephanodiscus triporus TaxID=2934178 RepID=A0ABD3NQB6_9STRA